MGNQQRSPEEGNVRRLSRRGVRGHWPWKRRDALRGEDIAQPTSKDAGFMQSRTEMSFTQETFMVLEARLQSLVTASTSERYISPALPKQSLAIQNTRRTCIWQAVKRRSPDTANTRRYTSTVAQERSGRIALMKQMCIRAALPIQDMKEEAVTLIMHLVILQPRRVRGTVRVITKLVQRARTCPISDTDGMKAVPALQREADPALVTTAETLCLERVVEHR